MSSATAIPPTTAAASPSATPTTGCGAQTYVIPVADVACAMPFGANHTDVMAACCGPADVVAYGDECGVYCLAVGQTVDDLTRCLFDHGAPWGDVFCRGNGTATAADPSATAPATASVSVVATAGAGGSGDDDSGDGGSDDSSDDSNGNSDDAPENAARGLKPEFASAKAGLVIGALLFSATAFGAFQL